MEKLDKLSADLKNLTEGIAQAHRTLAEIRHEYTAMYKKVEAADNLAKQVTTLQEKLAKIAGFMSNG